MERVVCHCKKCGARLGESVNIWTRIGKAYFSPVVSGSREAWDLESHGEVREGEQSTLVEKCRLQDVACRSCRDVIGLECLTTPTNHVLDANQILLRLGSVAVTHAESTEPAELKFGRFLSLRDTSGRRTGPSASKSSVEASQTPPTHSCGDQAAAPEISLIQAEIELQRGDIERLDSAGYQIASAIDSAVDRLEREVDSLKDAVRGLRQGVDRDQEDLASLQNDLKDVKRLAQDTTAIERIEAQVLSSASVINEVKQGLGNASSQIRNEVFALKSELRQVRYDVDHWIPEARGTRTTVDEQAKEIATLRGSIAQLRQESDQGWLGESAVTNPSFPLRELDILTSSIAKIGNRASQIETLQMEFAILKGRVERIESRNSAADNQRLQLQHGLISAPTSGHRQQESECTSNLSHAIEPPKAVSSGSGASSAEKPNAKRQAVSSGSTDTLAQEQTRQGRLSEPSPSSAAIVDVGPRKKRGGVRSTRRGTEKRTTRRGSARPG